MRCESAAAQGLRSDKTATKTRALEPHFPLPSTPGLRVADLHALFLLAWHPVATQP